MSSTLALAQHLSTFTLCELRELVQTRRLASPAKVQNTLSLAAALLEKNSISNALAALPKGELSALIQLATQSGPVTPDTGNPLTATCEVLAKRALVTKEQNTAGFRAIPEVSTAVLEAAAKAELTFAAPAAGAATDTKAKPIWDTKTCFVAAGELEKTDYSSWKPALLTAHSELLELSFTLCGYPARAWRGTKLQASALQVLHERTKIPLERIPLATQILEKNGYITAGTITGGWGDDKHYVRLTTTGYKQLLESKQSYIEQWLHLATKITAQLHPVVLRSIREMVTQHLTKNATNNPEPLQLPAALAQIFSEHPLLQSTVENTLAEFLALATYLGLCAADHLTPAALLLILGKRDAASAFLTEQLPGETAKGYIQPDLSVIFSGIPAAEQEYKLLRLSSPDQLGAAQVRRITRGSLRNWLEHEKIVAATEPASDTKQSLTQALSDISLTDLPQPLEYLLEELATKPARISVSEHPTDPQKSVICARSYEDAREIMSDKGLALLHLRPTLHSILSQNEEHQLLSSIPAAETYAALHYARYDVSSATVYGENEFVTKPPQTADAAAELIDRVYSAQQADDTNSTQMIIELAIAERLALHITAVAREQEYEFTVIPLSLNAGRLRVRDEAADTERTLPLDSITAIQPVTSTTR